MRAEQSYASVQLLKENCMPLQIRDCQSIIELSSVDVEKERCDGQQRGHQQTLEISIGAIVS